MGGDVFGAVAIAGVCGGCALIGVGSILRDLNDWGALDDEFWWGGVLYGYGTGAGCGVESCAVGEVVGDLVGAWCTDIDGVTADGDVYGALTVVGAGCAWVCEGVAALE